MKFTKDNPAAILTDVTRCTGCEQCVAACKKENRLGRDRAPRWSRSIDDLSATRFTTIVRKDKRFTRKQCRHCLEPACASACIVGALKKTEEGPVVYDGDLCMGCRYCMVACPYDVPRYDWDKAVPYIRKCTLCYERLKDGRQPACTEACPEEATIFGARKDLLTVAKNRMEKNPKGYIQKVFGEVEVGGASVLYLSDISLGFLGWRPEMGTTPLPDLTWRALSKVPPVILGMGGLMTAVWWVIGRRMKLQVRAALEATPDALADAPSVNRNGEDEETNKENKER